MLKQQLESYAHTYPQEGDKIRNFLPKLTHSLYSRKNLEGHLTASAFILHPEKKLVLLMFHKKLQIWLQPGGHVEDQTDLLMEALREAKEETGLEEIDVLSNDIFDFDIHEIPERPGEPAHLHYDVCFLFRAKEKEFQKNKEEALDMAWFDAPPNKSERLERLWQKK